MQGELLAKAAANCRPCNLQILMWNFPLVPRAIWPHFVPVFLSGWFRDLQTATPLHRQRLLLHPHPL